jgi:hypothetical protein
MRSLIIGMRVSWGGSLLGSQCEQEHRRDSEKCASIRKTQNKDGGAGA